MASDQKYKVISKKQLVRVFKDIQRLKSCEQRFCFLIGAGASVSSGIPSGRELSARWYGELIDEIGVEEKAVWEKTVGCGLTPDTVGEFYPFLYGKRYEINPELGYDELTKLMEDVEPGIGYVILSQILTREKHNFVITTNFDYLVEDAIRQYSSKKPFVAGHETLAKFVSSQAERPTVIKVHRDLFLHPLNDRDGTSKLKEEWGNTLLPILKSLHLLVIGYGGNDGSLMEYLKGVGGERRPVYWCVLDKEAINPKVASLLTERDFVVEIEGFDELMCDLNEALGYGIFKNLEDVEKHPIVEAAKERVRALERGLKKSVSDLSKEDKGGDKRAVSLKNIVQGASGYMLRAYVEKDAGKKEKIYREGMERYPSDWDLIASYASFLREAGRFEDASLQYQRAAGIKPDSLEVYNDWGNSLGAFAKTKQGVEADKLYSEAFEKYREALRLKPDSFEVYNNWGSHLGAFAKTKQGIEVDKLYGEAFEKYGEALRLKPDSFEVYNNWGSHLGAFAKTKQGVEADKLYGEAFEKYGEALRLKPDFFEVYYNLGNNLGDFAKTKQGVEADRLYGDAFEKYGEALRLKPDYYKAYNNWGSCLGDFAKTKQGVEADRLYGDAFEKYGEALLLKPDSFKVYYNWGGNLGDFAKTKQGAEADRLYKEAFEKLRKGVELGGDSYNLACLYALRGDRKNALFYLEDSLQKFGTKPDFVKQDEDWAAYRGNPGFMGLLKRFAKKN